MGFIFSKQTPQVAGKSTDNARRCDIFRKNEYLAEKRSSGQETKPNMTTDRSRCSANKLYKLRKGKTWATLKELIIITKHQADTPARLNRCYLF